MGKPGRLTFGVLPRGEHRPAFGVGKADLAAQERKQVRHPKRPHRRQGRVQTLGGQGCNFLNRPGRQHGGKAAGDGGAQFGAGRVEPHDRKFPAWRGRRGGEPFRQASPGAAPYFPGARDPLAVVGA